jgi:hypothetical protein
MRDLGRVQLDLNTHFNFIHLKLGYSLAAGLLSAKKAFYGVNGSERSGQSRGGKLILAESRC